MENMAEAMALLASAGELDKMVHSVPLDVVFDEEKARLRSAQGQLAVLRTRVKALRQRSGDAAGKMLVSVEGTLNDVEKNINEKLKRVP